MKNLLSFLFLFIIYQTCYSQTDANKIVLGIPKLAMSQQQAAGANTIVYDRVGDITTKNVLTDAYTTEISSVVQVQAGKIKSLNVVARSTDATQKLNDELNKQMDPSSVNADVYAEAGKQLGATYLLVGTVSKIDFTRKFVKNGPFNVPMYAKFVNIQVAFSFINVSTGLVDSTINLGSDLIPIIEVTESRTIDKGIKNMGPKFLEFIQGWYNNKTGIVNTKK